jgi:hypothetical protein
MPWEQFCETAREELLDRLEVSVSEVYEQVFKTIVPMLEHSPLFAVAAGDKGTRGA